MEGVTTVGRRLRRPLRHREGRAAAEARPRLAARGRARPGRQRHLRRLRQGRRGQVDADRQPRRRAGRRRQEGRRSSTPTSGATRSRACSASAAERPPVSPERKILPARGPRREGHVDRLLRRGGRRGRLARADAAQGADPVPRGRRLGRAGLPARRPAAGHRRRLDDARPAAARREVPDRHDAAADRAEGRAPRRRDGAQGRPRGRRRRREHGRVHDPVAASASRSSARAAARSWPTSSTCRCWARSR